MAEGAAAVAGRLVQDVAEGQERIDGQEAAGKEACASLASWA